MTTREALKALLTEACPGWTVTYEAGRLMNVQSQQMAAGAKFIYIEEFTSGKYLRPFGRPGGQTMTEVQVWFCKYKLDAADNTRDRAGAPDASAELRELVREEIETQAVTPFLDAFTSSTVFVRRQTEFPFAKPGPRFSDREVSIMVQVEVQLAGQC